MDPAFDEILKEGERRLRAICEPEKVTERAFADQERVIVENGGEAAILARGEFPHTPAPGEAPDFEWTA